MTLKREIPPHAARKLAELAPVIVKQVADAVAAGHPADSTLSNHFRSHHELGSRDRRFLSNVVFSFFRWRGWTRDLDMGPALVLSHQLDAVEIHPAIAILADKSDLQPLAGLSLEEKAAAVDGARIDDLVPAWFREILYEPDIHLRKCIEAFQKRPPTWLRVTNQSFFPTPLAKPHPTIPGAWSVTGSPPLADPHVEIQDIASQSVGLICAPKAGESWWDVCAGSGGKSLHLADLMGNQGLILATDIRESALEELRRRAKRACVNIIKTRVAGSPANEKFAGVLVDAPCSGIGTWSRNPDARWRTSADDVRNRARVQAELLRQAAEKVRTGGCLVYSVCTITSAETVDIIEPFLRERKDFTLDTAPHWIWPWDGPCDGMFVARMISS
jgi:16S rRNA (cytosine967-C5)-methyltransferase